MKKKVSSIPLAIIALLSTLYSLGQKKKAEFSVSIAGPNSSVLYKSAEERSIGNGFNAGLRYSVYLNEALSVGIAAEYQSYKSQLSYNSIAGAYSATDSENENFEFRYKITALRENQNLGYVNIPLGLQFETQGKTKLFLGAGFKIGFNVSGNFETKIQNLTTSGYYSQYNAELFSPEFAGFGNIENLKQKKQNINLNTSYSATIESGIKQFISKNKYVYVSVYLDYGLNAIADKNQNKELVQYTSTIPVNLQFNSLLNSSFTKNPILFSYGFKLRYAIRR